MDSNLTEIVVVLDRSGSMASMKTEAEGGLAAFVADQKGQPGAARLTLAIFDHEYDLIHDRADLREVPGRFALEPRGMRGGRDGSNDAVAFRRPRAGFVSVCSCVPRPPRSPRNDAWTRT